MALCVSKCVGNTPLLRLSDQIYAKLETLNPSGSVKDRMAKFLLDRAEERGEIQPGGTIVEATSGNTGIAFSMLAAERGYKMIVVMPSNMSEERKGMIRSFGAQIVEVGPGDFLGAVVKRDELAAQIGAFCPKQFTNPDNVDCHHQTTGKEILEQLRECGEERPIVAFVAGTGTGGTLMGVRRALIAEYPELKIVAVEPTESAVMSGGAPGLHDIQGIGDGFIPELVDMSQVDEVIAVSSQESKERICGLAKSNGLFVGISSGANVAAAEKFLEKHQPQGVIVTILPDRQERYLSLLR